MCSQTISSTKNKSINKIDSFFPLVLRLLSHLVRVSEGYVAEAVFSSDASKERSVSSH